MLIKNGRVHDGLGTVSVRDIRIGDGLIQTIGEDLSAAADEEVFDAAGMEILPGFVHALSSWGVNGSTTEIRPSSEDNSEKSNPITPELDAFYAFNGRAATAQQLGAFGLTSCGVAPADTNLFGGRIAAFTVDGVNPYKMCLKRDIGMMASVGGQLKRVYGERSMAPQTRMWIFTNFALQLKLAQDYKSPEELEMQAAEKAEAAGTPAPAAPPAKRDEKMEALREVVDGRLPLFVYCDDLAAIERVREIVSAYPKLRLALVGGYGLTGEEDWLIRENIPLVVRQASCPLDKEEMALDMAAIAKLAEKGAQVILGGSHSAVFAPREDMLWSGAEMMRQLHDSEKVLSMLTSAPAKLLGIDGVTGSLQEGLRADLVIWSADPMETYQAHIVRTYMGGEIIYREGDAMRCM